MAKKENTHTIEHLRELQALPLDIKVRMTQQRVREWIREYDENGVYISFSGGKDSTVLLDVVRKEFPNIRAVFVDTGLEYPEIKEFVKSFDNVDIIRPKMSFREVIERYGYPAISKEISKKIHYQKQGSAWTCEFFDDSKKDSRYNVAKKWHKFLNEDAPNISDRCCQVMKKSPANQYEKVTGRKPVTAQMTDESLLREQQWLRNGCNAFDIGRPKSNPMSFWTEQDVLQYIVQNDLPICSVYGQIIPNGKGGLKTTGIDRTGCVFCMFGVQLEKYPNRFQRMEHTHPKLWEYCMRDWDKGGLDLKRVLDYMNVPYKNETEDGQTTLLKEE